MLAVEEDGTPEAGESAAEYVFVTPEGRAVSVTDEGYKLIIKAHFEIWVFSFYYLRFRRFRLYDIRM